MGYLNNQVITVDAILTKKGRELLAAGNGSFNITQFALSDDEVDYTLYNPNHPSGSAYYGEAIENMPLLEAFPDEMQMMKYKLVTLPRGTQVMPILSSVPPSIMEPQLSPITISPNTLNYLSGVLVEPSGYSFTISDARVVTTNGFVGSGVSSEAATLLNASNSQMTVTNGTSTSMTVIGTSCTITPTGNNVIFGSSSTLYATLIVVGLDSGARVQIPLFVTRTTTA
tara:strand:- start:2379 stop:3059 length:681 start_codon:yes stop_codon:yes gene_type:complete